MIRRGALLFLFVVFALNARIPQAHSAVSDRQMDVAYGPHPHQRLDMYWSATPTDNYPVVVFIHGGSLTTGDKQDEDYGSVYKPFVKAGYAFATINYRLLSDSVWPAQAHDCASAIHWVREAVAKHDGQAHPMFLVGHSSGAALVALLGADGEYLGAYGIAPTDLAGIVPMGSIMWDEDFEAAAARIPADSLELLFAKSSDRDFGTVARYRDHWPMAHINGNMPPYLFLIAEAEQEHPPILKHATVFSDSARALGVEADWIVLKDRTHTSAIRKMSEEGDPAFAAIRDFITRQTSSPVDR